MKYFWQTLKNREVSFGEDSFKRLIQIALLAYDRGTLDDAYKMLSFVSTYYPKHYKTYLYLGSVVQLLHGVEEAATFFKAVTSIFAEPDLLFLAAENEIQRENTTGARDYLQKAKEAFAERDNPIQPRITPNISLAVTPVFAGVDEELLIALLYKSTNFSLVLGPYTPSAGSSFAF